MALDVLALGGFIFTDFAVPETLPAGGRHQLRVHKMPGGDRKIDAMGPDDDDRHFEVLHYGPNALADAQTLDQMRISGQPYSYSNGVEARIVVVAAAPFKVEKFNVVHQSITLTPVDNPAGPSSPIASSSDSLVGSDLSSASATASANVTNSTPVTTPVGSGGIGSA